MTKYAVILANMGAPASLDEVRPFLFNLFADPRMIRLPKLPRLVLAFLISRLRNKKSRRMYETLGGASPLLEATYSQARALETELQSKKTPDEYRVFPYMRYTEPSLATVLKELEGYKPDKLIILPLYPQLSTSTTLSVFDIWDEVPLPQIRIDRFWDQPLFLAAQCRLVKQVYGFAIGRRNKVRVIFSAHSIPQDFVDKGDPYEQQTRANVQAIVERLGITDWRLTYQSKVGFAKWLGPATADEILAASKEGYFIVLVPISFVADNLEVNYEMDILYKNLAIDNGASGCFRVPTLGSDGIFIEALAEVIVGAANHDAQK